MARTEEHIERRRKKLREMDEHSLRLQRDPQIQPDIRYRHLAEEEWDHRQAVSEAESENAKQSAENDRLNTENAALRQQLAQMNAGHGWTKAQVIITGIAGLAAGITATALVYGNFFRS